MGDSGWSNSHLGVCGGGSVGREKRGGGGSSSSYQTYMSNHVLPKHAGCSPAVHTHLADPRLATHPPILPAIGSPIGAAAYSTPMHHNWTHPLLPYYTHTHTSPPEWLRQCVLAGCWQHPHELVEGAEGLAQVEADGQAGQVDQVTGKGGVVEGVEPVSRRGDTWHWQQQQQRQRQRQRGQGVDEPAA